MPRPPEHHVTGQRCCLRPSTVSFWLSPFASVSTLKKRLCPQSLGILDFSSLVAACLDYRRHLPFRDKLSSNCSRILGRQSTFRILSGLTSRLALAFFTCGSSILLLIHLPPSGPRAATWAYWPKGCQDFATTNSYDQIS